METNKLDSYKNYIKPFIKCYSNNPENIDEGLKFIRDLGASIGESLLVVKQVLQISLKDADYIIMNSETWKDLRAETLSIRHDLEKAVDVLAEEDKSFKVTKDTDYIHISKDFKQ